MNIQELAQFTSDLQKMASDNASLTNQVAQLTNQVNADGQQIKAATQNAAALIAQVTQLTDQVTQLTAENAQIKSLLVPAWQQQADQLVAEAKVLMAAKVPYVFGGESAAGMDCSGFIQSIYNVVGIHLPRVSDNQRQQGKEVTKEEIRPGDLIGFNLNPKVDSKFDHIGMSLGGNLMIHTAGAPEGINVCDWTTRYSYAQVAIRRVLPD